MSLILTVATHHKMSTSLKPPPCVFSPSAYIGKAGIRYGFQELFLWSYYSYILLLLLFLLLLLLLFMQKSNHYPKFVGTRTVQLNTEAPPLPKIFCVCTCVYIIWWTLSNTSVVVRILWYYAQNYFLPYSKHKHNYSLTDVNIIPCQMLPHLADQGIPNPSQIHQIHIVSQTEQHSRQRKPS